MTVDVTSSTERSRRWRRRVREGLLVAQVEVPAPLVERLIAADLLSDAESNDSAAIGRALIELVTQRLAGRA